MNYPVRLIEGFEKIKDDLLTRRYAFINSDMSPDVIDEVVATFNDFRSLPLDVKKQFVTLYDPENPKTDIGYVEKRVARGNKDNKDLFMYNRAMIRDKGTDALFNTGEPRIDRFFEALDEAYSITEEMTRRVARTLDDSFEDSRLANGEPYQSFEKAIFRMPETPIYMRMVFYLDHGNHVDGNGVRWLAQEHYDHSPLTFAFSESARGLLIGSEEEKQRIEHQPGKSVVFMGNGAKIYFPQETHDSLGFHGVRTDESITPYNDEVKRWAFVAFVNPGSYSSFAQNQPTLEEHFCE